MLLQCRRAVSDMVPFERPERRVSVCDSPEFPVPGVGVSCTDAYGDPLQGSISGLLDALHSNAFSPDGER